MKVKQLIGMQINQPSYIEYTDPELFTRIATHIGLPKSDYRVVSIGMHPAVSLLNGFYALDAYQTNYPLEYKKQFRRIIASELERSPELKDYFDTWGSRCYVFTELGQEYLLGKNSGAFIETLCINTAELRRMGGKYIFSAVPIRNAASLTLVEDGIFEGKYWKIYLYRLD
jgi:hypothetical protein